MAYESSHSGKLLGLGGRRMYYSFPKTRAGVQGDPGSEIKSVPVA